MVPERPIGIYRWSLNYQEQNFAFQQNFAFPTDR
jgi:hypothetical protein